MIMQSAKTQRLDMLIQSLGMKPHLAPLLN